MGVLRHPKVILLSVDGLRADFCTGENPAAPTLTGLAKAGLRAKTAYPVYPTVTFTNHASIATGVLSARHGIYGNTRFVTTNGEYREWYMNVEAIKAPTIWDQALIAGRSATLLRWPITSGARVSANIPEVFDATSEDETKTWRLTLEHSTPWLMKAMLAKPHRHEPRSRRDYDVWVTDVLRHVIECAPTDLIMAHFVDLDHAQHNYGCDSIEAYEALKRTDALIRSVLSAVDTRKTSLFVFGDHGMIDFDKRFNINALFAQKGWITFKHGTIRDWRVLAHINCGQAAVYVKDPALNHEVLNTLAELAPGRFEILDRLLLNRLGSFPEALCAVDCLPGFSMGEEIEGEIFVKLKQTRGEHGHGFRPEHPNMRAGFLAVGPSLEAGRVVDSISLTEIAPLTAALMGFNMPGHHEEAPQLVRSQSL